MYETQIKIISPPNKIPKVFACISNDHLSMFSIAKKHAIKYVSKKILHGEIKSKFVYNNEHINKTSIIMNNKYKYIFPNLFYLTKQY